MTDFVSCRRYVYAELSRTYLNTTGRKYKGVKHMKINIGIKEKIITFIENSVGHPVGINIIKTIFGNEVT